MSNSETTFTFSPERDKYGRNCHALRSYPAYRAHGYVVRLPKCAIETRTDGNKYFTNNWAKSDDAIRYYRTLKAAKAGLLAEASA